MTALRTLVIGLLIVFSAVEGLYLARADAPESEFVSRKKLIQVFSTDDIDKIIQIIDAIGKMSYRGQVLPVLIDAWLGRSDKYPNMSWAVLNTEIVRLYIGSMLYYADRNGDIDIDEEEVHQFLRRASQSEDTDVRLRAVIELIGIRDSADVVIFLNIAHERDRKTFRAALIGLSSNCGEAADKALDEIEESIDSPQLQEHVQYAKRKREEFKRVMAEKWCE